MNPLRLRLFLIPLLIISSTSLAADQAKPNTLTDQEKQDGWKLLFDGSTTTGWRKLGFKEFPTKAWSIEDGAFHLAKGGGGGDLAYQDKFENFELSFEWKVAPGSNSGVKYRVQEQPRQSFAFGCEYQIIDDNLAADARMPKRQTASLYDVIAPKADKKLKPVGEWNQSRIIVKGNHAEHWLNGEKVVEFDFFSPEWEAAVAKSKFKNRKDFGRPALGYITIQDHQEEAWYRSIKIKVLGN